jgi:predicted ATP-grasp superfamily ATP-dependent carboligase
MRVFVYEYLSAQETTNLAPSLRNEGRAMLAAAIADFASLPGIEVRTILPASLPCDLPGVVRFAPGEELDTFRTEAARADYTLVIAPEFDDLLESRAHWVLEAGGQLLGSSPEAVRLCGDKLALAATLHAASVPTPQSWTLEEVLDAPTRFPLPLVCKPRHGAGSQATFLIEDRAELAGSVLKARAEGFSGALIVQPFVGGMAASVAALLGSRHRMLLPPAEQFLSSDGRFRYRGGRVPMIEPLAERAHLLAERAFACVPGLLGYAGVDLVLGEEGDWVLEINPRLTTSYVGLRALTRDNLAGVWLRLVQSEDPPPLVWENKSVRFTSDAVLEESYQ